MKLQTKSGASKFNGHVQVAFENAELIKRDDRIYVVQDGEELGELAHPNVIAKGKKYLSTELVPSINAADLVGKDPTTLTKEELVVLTQYLQEMAGNKVKTKPAKEEAPAKASKKAPVVEEEEEEDEAEEIELPEGIETYEDLAALGSKELWKDVVKPIVGELEGITSRSKKDEMLAAAAEYYELEPTEDEDEEEEEEVKPSKKKPASKKAPVVEEDEDDEEEDEDDLGDEFEDDEDEDEEDLDDEEDEEDDEDDLDEDEEDEEDEDDDYEDDEEDEEEDEDDDEEYDEDEEDEDEDDEDDDEVTEKDVDNLFKAGDKKAIIAFCKQHDITLPKKKLSSVKVKQIIKEALFGEE